MADDPFSCLVDEVKDEAIENYVSERRLIDSQIEELEKQAKGVRECFQQVGKRISRLSYFLMVSDFPKRLSSVLEKPLPTAWNEPVSGRSLEDLHPIRVHALTNRAKFHEVVVEAYRRLYYWMEKYAHAYEDLKAQTRAVNINIRSFQKNHDVGAVFNFLRSIDVCRTEMVHYLGENFTAEEMGAAAKTLAVHPVRFEQLGAARPIPLPETEQMESSLIDLANEVYEQHRDKIEDMMEVSQV